MKHESRLKNLLDNIILFIIFIITMLFIFEDFEKKAAACDSAKGYTCSYYDVRHYLINK